MPVAQAAADSTQMGEHGPAAPSQELPPARPRGAVWMGRALAGIFSLAGIVLAVAAVASSDLVAPSPADGDAPPEASPLYINTVDVTQIDSPRVPRTFAGIVKARRDSELGFDRAGRLVRVLAREGDRVQAGDVLAELDMEGLETKRTKLDEALQQARAALSQSESAPPATAAEMQRAVQQLKAELNQLELLSAQSRPANSTATFQALQRRVQIAEARVRSLEQQFQGQSQAAASERAADLEAQRAALEVELQQSTLVAPFDGLIAARHLDEGAGVAPGRPVVRILEEAYMEARFRLPADVASRLKSGASQTLELDGQELAGTVGAKSPQLDPSARTRTVVIEFPDASSQGVLPGQMARLSIDVVVDDVGCWLPLSALTRGARGLWSVYVVETDDQGAHRVAAQPVELLFLDADRAFVRGTLNSGQRVVADGTHRIVPGQRVLFQDTLLDGGPAPSPRQ